MIMSEQPLPPPKLSVVIRCRNEAQGLRRVFAALHAQCCDFEWEVMLVDNESEDDTRAVAADFGARILTISRQEFSYGRAINRGIAAARGELVLLLSAHALPLGSHFLAAAVAPFHDQQVAAARCLLVTKRQQLESWFQPKNIQYSTTEEQQRVESGQEWVGLYPAATCCVLRRSVWDEIRYDENLEANEDKHWASRVLARQYKIHCCAEAFWLHTRKFSRRERWKKEYRELTAIYRINQRAPMTWPKYLWLNLKVLLKAPVVAFRFTANSIIWNTYLLSIPWRAKRAPQTGSVPDFNQKQ